VLGLTSRASASRTTAATVATPAVVDTVFVNEYPPGLVFAPCVATSSSSPTFRCSLLFEGEPEPYGLSIVVDTKAPLPVVDTEVIDVP